MDQQFLYSLVTGMVIGGVAGYLGSLMITKRTALVGDALGHVALPGVALALIYGFNVSWGAVLCLILGILLIWLFKIRSRLPIEALTGIVFTASVAIAFLFLPEDKLSTALIGDISQVGTVDLISTILFSLAIFLILKKSYNRIVLAELSENLARLEGVRVNWLDLLFLFSIGIVVALGIKVTGSLLMGALVIIPAAAARNLSRNLTQYSYLSLVIGAFSCALGILFFKLTHFPAGPLIILTATAIFLVSLLKREA